VPDLATADDSNLPAAAAMEGLVRFEKIDVRFDTSDVAR